MPKGDKIDVKGILEYLKCSAYTAGRGEYLFYSYSKARTVIVRGWKL